MTGDALFRWVVLAGFVATVAIVAPYRARSHTREPLDRRKEGLFILATLRPAGAALWIGVIAYTIDPGWMSWASVPLPDSWRWPGVVLFAAGAALLAWTMPTLGTNLTDTVVTRQHHTLVTGGPYRWIRHPFYGAMALVSAGAALLTANWFILASAIAAFTLLAVRSRVEEEQLEQRFGDPYRAYKRRTGGFLPRL